MKTSASLHKKRHERSKIRAEQKLTARFRSGRKPQQDGASGQDSCNRDASVDGH
jgi:hypothetical protein